MQIIFLLPDLPRSGAATRTVYLAEHLVEQGASVHVATFLRRVDAGMAARLERSGIGVLRLPTGSAVLQLRHLLRSGKDTIVHAAMPTAGLLGLCLARAYAHPMVYTYTNCLHIQRPFRRLSVLDILKARLERLMADHSEALHTVSHSVATQLRRSYPHATARTHAIVYPSTPPIGEDVVTGISCPGFADAYPKLLAVGRLLPHKRFGDAIKAITSVRLHWPRAMLVVLGAGPELGPLQCLVSELGLSDNVCLPGESRTPEAYFAWADLLLHPSLYEGYPRVAAEACATLLPVVSIDTPYGRELTRMSGRVQVARPCDSESLAKAILAALAQGSPSQVVDHPSDAGREIHSLYHQLLGRRRGSAHSDSDSSLTSPHP
jgi:glycosyltransferase involved in cell wall biosynthesis